jgi:pimeloyl-ACP methyl ester carboxylesterase
MALPALVLVHGGGMAADSWGLVVEEIHRLAPELTVLALDMPGRRNKPGDLREMTIADYVDSLVGDIESAGLDEIVIVGHSLGAMMLPGVVTRLGAARVREMIFAAAFLPPGAGRTSYRDIRHHRHGDARNDRQALTLSHSLTPSCPVRRCFTGLQNTA